jgi:hypothetical protein
MAELRNVHLASDFSEADVSATSSGDLAHSSEAGLGGTTGGARCVIDDTNEKYLGFDFTAISSTDFTARWYVSGLEDLTMASDEFAHGVVLRTGGTSRKAWLSFRNLAGQRQIGTNLRNDAGTTISGTHINWPSPAPEYLQIHIKKATNGTGADDAFMDLYFEDEVQETARVSGVDCFDHFTFDQLRVGAGSADGPLDAGTSGTIDFDEIAIRNDDTLPGSTSSAPVNTVPGTQTCVFGTQKSVTGTSVADSDSDLATIRVQQTGNATCTLTLSGCTVTAGALDTNDFTISGTQANLNTAIGTLKTDNAEVLGTRAASTTITITSTDDEAASDADTITCNWAIETGVGTKSLKLTGTATQINAALATLEWTPTTDFVGTTQVSMYSLTSTPLDDTDTFDIVVNEEGGGVASVIAGQNILRIRRRRRR